MDFYRIQRRAAGSDEWLVRDVKWINEATYVDRQGIRPNTRYIYRMQSVDIFDREGPVTRLAVRTPAAP